MRSQQPRPSGSPPEGRSAPPFGGPLPQPWSPPKSAERGETGGAGQDKDVSEPPSFRPNQSGTSAGQRPADNKNVETTPTGGGKGSGTALRTKIKNLKKERGGGGGT